MPIRKRTHMTVFRGVMMAHAPVVTEATTSGGWIGWIPAKMSPATSAAKPLQRMRLDAVTFILLLSLRRLWSGHLRSRVRLLHLLLSAYRCSVDIRAFASSLGLACCASGFAIRHLRPFGFEESDRDQWQSQVV